MSEKRNQDIDILKGVAILLMILGHMQLPQIANNFIFSFHMPLFFFVSGFLYKEKSLASVIKGNIQKVIIPYFFTCLIVWAWKCHEGEVSWGWSILLANGSFPVWHYNEYFVGPLWFLACFFIASVGFKLLRGQKSPYAVAILLILWVIAIFYKRNFNLLPFDILNAIPAILCMEFGFQLRNERIQKIFKNPCVFSCGLLIWCFCIYFGVLTMASLVYKLWVLQLIGALFGTLLIYYFIGKIGKGGGIILSFLSFSGRVSLVIVCAHSLDYLLHITSTAADFFFEDNILRNVAYVLFRFLFVYIVYYIFKYIPLTRKIYRI